MNFRARPGLSPNRECSWGLPIMLPTDFHPTCFVAVPQAGADRGAANKCVSDKTGLAVEFLSHGFNDPYATNQYSRKIAAELILEFYRGQKHLSYESQSGKRRSSAEFI